jgi:hypothetical protein
MTTNAEAQSFRFARNARWRAPPTVIDDSRSACLQIREFPRRFVYNADLDGVLSAHLLCKHLGWEPVGASACSGLPSDGLWFAEGPLGAGVVFIDLWAAPAQYAVIDQHIVAIDPEHAEELRRLPMKINPNLLWMRTAEVGATDEERHYQWKYPFGVVHFLIAALESMGESVRIEDAPLRGSASVLDLILRADDAARSTAGKYRANALGWWDYLCSVGGPTTAALAERACGVSEAEAGTRQAEVEAWIHGCGHRHSIQAIGRDAGLSTHLRREGWNGAVDGLVGVIGAACGFASMASHSRWVERRLHGERSSSADAADMRARLGSPSLFSYAVTARFGSKAASGFSCSFRQPAGT